MQAALEALLAADLAMANGGILACHASRKQIAAAIEALRAALAEPQPEPVAEVHAGHLRPADNGAHWCREVLLYSGNNPGDKSASGPRVKLYAAPQAQQPQPELLECDIEPRPLSHPLRDYHIAISEGPLNYTWQDKPHRLVYDLIAAVRYYAAHGIGGK